MKFFYTNLEILYDFTVTFNSYCRSGVISCEKLNFNNKKNFLQNGVSWHTGTHGKLYSNTPNKDLNYAWEYFT